jgi:hypothetical protein
MRSAWPVAAVIDMKWLAWGMAVAATQARAQQLPRGVPMSKAARYAGADGHFSCEASSGGRVPLGSVNDGYCDCPGNLALARVPGL